MPASKTIDGRQIQGGAVIPVYLVETEGIIAFTLAPGTEVDVIDRANRDLGRVDIADELPAGTQVIGQVQILGTYDGVNFVPPQLDGSTFATNTIDYSHHEIHSGSFYHCWYLQTVGDIGDRTIISFRTPNTTKYLHMFPHYNAVGAAHARLLEAPTITDNAGASLAIYNRNRNSPNTSGVWDTSQNPDVQNQATYFTEATMGAVTLGTEISHWHLQAAPGNKPAGGESRADNEWVLLPNTLYAFEIESLSAEASICIIRLNWYEHVDKAA